MPTDEFSRKVRNDSTSMEVAQSGAVDVTDDATRDLGQVDVANQPLGVDDSTPIAVDDQSAGGGKVDVVQETVISEQFLSSGSSASGTLSPPSGEVWELIGVFYHADVGGGTSGDLRVETIYQDGGDFTPHNYLARVHMQYDYEGWISTGFNSAYQSGGGSWVTQSTATTHVNEADTSAPYWLPASMRINCKVTNNTDVSSSKTRATALVRKYQVA